MEIQVLRYFLATAREENMMVCQVTLMPSNFDRAYRSIGISNYYTLEEYEHVTSGGEIKPGVIQNENHPFYQNTEFQKDIAKYGTVGESWYPFGGRGHTQDLFGNETIMDIAKARGKTSALMILCWHLQTGCITIPGSQNPDHILENYNIFVFDLTDAQMQRMAELHTGRGMKIGEVC